MYKFTSLEENKYKEDDQMSEKHSNNNQFKENSNSGEKRNGRKSPFKNHSEGQETTPNEYKSKK